MEDGEEPEQRGRRRRRELGLFDFGLTNLGSTFYLEENYLGSTFNSLQPPLLFFVFEIKASCPPLLAHSIISQKRLSNYFTSLLIFLFFSKFGSLSNSYHFLKSLSKTSFNSESILLFYCRGKLRLYYQNLSYFKKLCKF